MGPFSVDKKNNRKASDMNSTTINNDKEKPEYGYYVGYAVIITLLILGIAGLIMFISGFFVKHYLNIIFWAMGALILIIFLWPGIGMLFTNRSAYKDERLHFDFLEKFDKAQILDCGCGTGRHAIPLAKQMPEGSLLTGIDIFDAKSISVNSLERVQKNAELEGVSNKTKFMVGSATEIPFDNETFDVVTCMGVMHELGKHKSKAFQEINRVLKLGGLFYFRELKRMSLIPSIGVLAFAGFKGEDYWENKLISNNFEIIDTYKGGNYYEFLAKRPSND